MPSALNALSPKVSSRPRATALSGGAPPPAPAMPQMQEGSGPPGMQPGGQQQTPAPSHDQTVASLRHFQAIATQLKALLASPDLGRTDMKDVVIDGTTRLVADRMIPPSQAVTTLATFPERPFDQKQWVTQHMQQIIQARDLVLAHHAAAFAGQGPQQAPDPSSHMANIGSMMSGSYSGQPNA